MFTTGIDHALAIPAGAMASSTRLTGAPRRRGISNRARDVIKLMPSGGIASTGDDPPNSSSNDEMRVAVETAHSLGIKVAAHIYPRRQLKCRDRGCRLGSTRILCYAQTFALMKVT